MKTTALAILALIASLSACASSPAPCQGRNCPPPTAGEKVAKELARAEGSPDPSSDLGRLLRGRTPRRGRDAWTLTGGKRRSGGRTVPGTGME
jgi:hypothetical protein